MDTNKEYHIFIEENKEGQETKFLKKLMANLKLEFSKENFSYAGGWENIKNLTQTLLDKQEQGIKNLIIFDADTKKHENGGEENRRKKLTEILTQEGITNTPIFLFPNNKDEGEFETLLCKLIPENHQQIMKCFTSYKECVEESPQYEIYEFEKAKPYVYISSCKKESIRSKFKKNNDWSFDNPIYWNLEHEALEPLKKFLTENLISQ